MGDFRFKHFLVKQDRCAMKVGTDGVLLGAWASGGSRILDIGVGTGLVSLMMAQRFPEATLVGIDMDKEACEQAMENVAASPFADRVVVENSRLQDFMLRPMLGGESEPVRLFDSIVSNPPFFVNSLKNPDARRSMARHADTLTFRELFQGVRRLLVDDGVFSAIVPSEVLDGFVAEGCIAGFYLVRRCAVKTVARKAPKRYLLSFARSRRENFEDMTVVMMEGDGERSEWYARITDDFYL